MTVEYDLSERSIERTAKSKKVKLLRAHRGCLGDDRRRRTRQAAKSHDKPLTGDIVVDIRMGQPDGATLHHSKES